MKIVRMESEEKYSQGYAVLDTSDLIVTWTEDQDPWVDRPSFKMKDNKVLFFTRLDVYGGGLETCQAFIDGYEEGLASKTLSQTGVGSGSG